MIIKSDIIEDKTVLVLADVHQCIFQYSEAVLAKEKGNFDQIVSLGDWYDSFLQPPEVYPVHSVTNYIINLSEEYDISYLVGNHDLAYIEALRWTSKCINPREQYYCCSGYTNSKAKSIATEFRHHNMHYWRDFFSHWKICMMVNGWLLSHAGVMDKFLPYADNDQSSIEKLFGHCKYQYENLHESFHPLFVSGKCRGGNPANIGGPLWCDWGYEFEDNLPWPQLVGHTRSQSVRKNGKSFCIDASESSYAVLYPNGNIRISNLDRLVNDIYCDNKGNLIHEKKVKEETETEE